MLLGYCNVKESNIKKCKACSKFTFCRLKYLSSRLFGWLRRMYLGRMYWTARRWLVCKNIQGRRRRREENPPSEIGVTWPQMCWGQRSARLCWNYRLGFYPQRTDLTVILETGSPPQRRTNFITTFFQLCLNKKKKASWFKKLHPIQQHQLLPPNLISHLRHNGKTRPLWTRLFKDSWKKGALDMTRGPQTFTF